MKKNINVDLAEEMPKEELKAYIGNYLSEKFPDFVNTVNKYYRLDREIFPGPNKGTVELSLDEVAEEIVNACEEARTFWTDKAKNGEIKGYTRVNRFVQSYVRSWSATVEGLDADGKKLSTFEAWGKGTQGEMNLYFESQRILPVDKYAELFPVDYGLLGRSGWKLYLFNQLSAWLDETGTTPDDYGKITDTVDEQLKKWLLKDAAASGPSREIKSILPSLSNNIARPQTYKLENTKLTTFLPSMIKTLDNWTNYTLDVGNKESIEITGTFTTTGGNRPVVPFDIMVADAIGSQWEEESAKKTFKGYIIVDPSTIWRTLAGLPKGTSVADSEGVQRVHESIEFLKTYGQLTINWEQLVKKKWRGLDEKKGISREGFILKAERIKGYKGYYDKYAKEHGHKEETYYKLTDSPMTYDLALLLHQFVPIARDELNTTKAALDGLRDENGKQIKPRNATVMDTIIKNTLYKTIHQMKGGQATFMYYETFQEKCFGPKNIGGPDKKKEKEKIRFKKSIDYYLTVFTAKGIIKGWTRRKTIAGKSTRHDTGFEVFLNDEMLESPSESVRRLPSGTKKKY